MTYIVEDILEAESKFAFGVRLLEPAIRDQLRELVFARYGGRSNRLWATASDCASVQNAEAWRWIRNFVGSRSCILFFDPNDEVQMFHVPSGSTLDDLLGNTFGFVFYVTDADATYLLSFNDHDFLVCCGSAREWLEKQDPNR
ncbi:MAG TPA: hypothetical protein VFT45_24065 [Longimicrobium sp.]|nr:hypothetical protein [Longimicrobium sp.]